MMLPTHVLAGAALASILAIVVAPAYTQAAIVGALVGSTLPDLDLYTGHRRTLHYPTGYILVAVPLVAAASVVGDAWLVGSAFLFVGAALHARMDRYGGGLELRPWEATSDRAVYDHVSGRWLAPKRWIRYDGAPEDVLLAILLGVPLFALLDDPFRSLVGGALLVGLVYGGLRRRLADVAPVVFACAPAAVDRHVPARYRQ